MKVAGMTWIWIQIVSTTRKRILTIYLASMEGDDVENPCQYEIIWSVIALKRGDLQVTVQHCSRTI